MASGVDQTVEEVLLPSVRERASVQQLLLQGDAAWQQHKCLVGIISIPAVCSQLYVLLNRVPFPHLAILSNH
jgi:hypothetical protein